MCRSISRPRFIMTLQSARLSLPSASAGRSARGWVTIVIGETAISFSGVPAIRVRSIGGMNLHASGTWGTRLSGALAIIRAQLRAIVATGAGAGIRWRARRPPLSRALNRDAQFHSVLQAQQVFPEPRRLQLGALHPSAGRPRAARSLASTARALRGLIAIAASRACRRSTVPRPAAVATAAPVVAAVATVVVAGINPLLL